jgi:fumarate hydratase class I
VDLARGAKRVNLEALTKEETATWKVGDRLLLTGRILTGRDAAHTRLADLIARGEKLPVEFTNRLIYYVGPVNAVRDEVVGPAGPTTSRRMDKFMDTMLGRTGLLGSIGKSERGAQALEAIKRHGGVHLIAIGGAAYLVSKAIRASRVLAFKDLGMEAIHEFEVKDMPVTVAVDTRGNAVHESGPREWRARIGKVPVTVA